jgi:hypothetical protein
MRPSQSPGRDNRFDSTKPRDPQGRNADGFVTAHDIVAAKADDVLAVKGNQPALHEGIKASFLRAIANGFGRIKVSRHETRVYYVCEAPADLPDRARWTKLTARRFAEAVRCLWSIENQLHWQQDETFQEDQSRLREGHAATNFSLVRRAALSLLKNEHTTKLGVKNKRLNAAWDDNYLLQVLFNS